MNLNFPGVELLHAIIGKIPDERIFSRHDLLEIEADLSGADAPRFGMAGQVHHFRGVKQRLRGHAAAQDAQSADFLAAFDDDGFQTRARRRPRRRVTGAAAAENRHVVIKSFHAGEDGSTARRKCKFQICIPRVLSTGLEIQSVGFG